MEYAYHIPHPFVKWKDSTTSLLTTSLLNVPTQQSVTVAFSIIFLIVIPPKGFRVFSSPKEQNPLATYQVLFKR
jgi:hypothetical protein